MELEFLEKIQVELEFLEKIQVELEFQKKKFPQSMFAITWCFKNRVLHLELDF